jgi:oxygen-dependent protoporphyrinogen oxidase
MTRSVAVIGGGITGLAASRHLAYLSSDHDLSITVFEGEERLGGKISTSPFAGRAAVDEGPDAFLVRMPAAIDLTRSLGLGDQITAPTDARAAIWYDGLRSIPDGVLLGVPTSLLAIARSGLLSPVGLARAGLDLVLPRTPTAHDSIGHWVRTRFGDEVHDRLVDALVGSIYGADTDRFSLAAVPQIAALAGRGRSALLSGRSAMRTTPKSDGPIFAAPIGGLADLINALERDLAKHHGDRVRIITSSPVAEITADNGRWRVDGQAFDAVINAAPAAAAAEMMSGDIAETLRTLETCGVAMVTLAVPIADWPEHALGRSGYLVPKSVQRTVTAVSFASQKWAHLGGHDSVVLRVSLGRDGLDVLHLDDSALIDAAVAEVSMHLGTDLAPVESRVTRWPGAFTQYRPHHHTTISHIERGTGAGLVLAGSSYRGIGIPACVADGQRAAERTMSHLEESVSP